MQRENRTHSKDAHPQELLNPRPSGLGHRQQYCDALPLYRQEFILNRMGVEIRRTTMAEWVTRVSQLLEPVYKALQKKLVKQPSLQADETRCKY